MSASRHPLSELRGLDTTTGIAGPYCTKVLTDAGVEMVKLEPPGGDPLRSHRAGGVVPPGEDGALFQFLNGGKLSTTADLDSAVVAGLLARAHVLVADDLSEEQVHAIRDAHPGLVVVTISPFGLDSPWRDRPVTEFTLQALAGSTAARGTADRPPLYAGGRIGDWVGGIVAAVAAAGALRSLERSGVGEHVDVSIFQAMTMMMGGYQSLLATLGAPPPGTPRRLVEIPSIEPTSDGHVGFCTITAQQFEDFLLLIERPDLLADEGLARAAVRQERRDEFIAHVHAWTHTRTTDEIIEAASALRIPVSPIGSPRSITSIDHFAERGVFVRQPDADFRRPRPPYLLDGLGPEVSAAPRLGDDQISVDWPPIPRSDRAEAPSLPLDGVRVLDLTAFWAGPSATHVLACLGAEVIKVESPRRPDGMRMVTTKTVEDPSWWEWSSIYQSVNVNKRAITLDLSNAAGRDIFRRLALDADVVVENFSPRVMDEFGLDHTTLLEINPRLVVARMPAFGLDGPWRDRVGFAQTMEQVSGLAWMTGWPDDAPLIPRGVCDPIAGMHAAFSIMGALRERDRSGAGLLLECPMVEAVLNVAAEALIEYEAYGTMLRRDGNRGPTAAPQGVYPCAGDERWLALSIVDDDCWRALVRLDPEAVWAVDERWDTTEGRRRHADELDELLASWTASQELDELVPRLIGAGIAAEAVISPEDVLDLEPIRGSGFVESVHHPLIGPMDLLGMPFRFSSRSGVGWIRTPAPLLGESNHDLLSELGLSDEQLEELTESGVIADRLLT